MTTIIISEEIKNLLIIPVYTENKKINFFETNKNKEIKLQILETLKIYNFEAKKEETLYFNINKQKILLIGINKNYTLEELRRAYSVVFKMVKVKQEFDVTIEIPKENESEIKSIIEGVDLSDYKFDKYLKKEEKETEIKINLFSNKKYESILKETLLINKNVKLARELVNENSNIIIPQKMETIVKEFAKKNKLSFKSLDEKQIQKEKLNLLYAVGKGASVPPRLIIVEYLGDKTSKEKLALVGKGITFDTGGVNLKSTGHVEDMKTDMAGSASCYAIFKTAVELKLKRNLILVMPMAENALSGSSYKPGDIFIGYNKISVEIANTDAEGRLVLADALSYVQKNYKITEIIDMATLTGACSVALGPSLIAMLGNNTEIKTKLFNSGEETFERVWELPMYDEHRELIKGKFADIKNSGGRAGGTITAAAFLERFIEKDVKWTHLDIASAARSLKEEYYIPEYGTARGVRLIINYLMK